MISGNSTPIVGEKNTYHIAGWYEDTPQGDRNSAMVTWELFKKRSNGKFTSTNIKKTGDGTFTFGEMSIRNTYRLEAYLYRPEGGGLIINPKPSATPRIGKVELHYVDDKKSDTFSFYDRLRAKAHTTGMPRKEIVFILWEDDSKGGGHSAGNQPIEIKSARVQHNGLAVAEFTLTKGLMQKAMKGEADAKEFEFYVTVEYYKGKIHDSKNVNVHNPFHKAPEKKQSHPKAPGSPAEQKPPSKREEKNLLFHQADGYLIHDWAEVKGKAQKNKEVTVNRTHGRSTVGVKAPPAVKHNDKNEVCECEAKVRAFMRMIRKGEGTIDEGGYSRIVGGSKFSNFKSHPKIYIKEHNSTAAGAYQITRTNWDSENFSQWRSINKVEDFLPESQDIYCAYLVIKKKGAFNDIKNNDLEGAINKCAKEWASLPGAGYGQREESIETVKNLYYKFLNEELTGQEGSVANLHIKPGFLKKYFGYNCCEENNDSKQITKKKYDINKAVAKINSNVEPKSISACAKYVRIAIEAGGLSTNGRPISAKNYDVFLPKLGFTQISTENYTPKKGDISVIQSIVNHPHGHICMYNGSHWVSDFKQIDMWPGPGYRKNPPRYNIFRWK